jgi:methylamine dehydrogenase heavy chain
MSRSPIRFDSTRRRAKFAVGLLSCLAGSADLTATAEGVLPADFGRGETEQSLSSPPSKHWVWINDIVFAHMVDGTAHLIDGDSGKYLGTLSTGFGFERLVLPRDGKLIYSPETYFSRGTRGTRTDVITIYDGVTLRVQGEIAIPAKRSSNLPKMGNAALTDDDRFLLVFNFTPAQSVTVADTLEKRFVAEVETAGCTLVYPTGARSFFSVCADGALLCVTLDGAGRALEQTRSQPLFDVSSDPVNDNPVRLGDTWYFVTYDGRVAPVKSTAHRVQAGETWWLATTGERQQGWRPAGLQQLAVHAGENALYALVRRGSRDTHKDPGQAVWTYDMDSKKHLRTIALRRPASSIQITTDEHPLLFATSLESDFLDVYDPLTGKLLRSVPSVATTPTLLLTP